MITENGPEVRHINGIIGQDIETGKYYFSDETERLYPELNNPQPYNSIDEANKAAEEYAKHL